jgi:hypothetical protein
VSKLLKAARVPLPPLSFTVQCWAEVTETATGDKAKSVDTVFKVTCDGKQITDDKESCMTVEFNNGGEIIYYDNLTGAFERAVKTIPKSLATLFAQAILCDGLKDSMRDDYYVPPLHRNDWSQEKLRQVVIWAITGIPKHANPTLARVAAHVSNRYSLNPPMKADALRMMLKRYELDWKELKKWKKGRK